MARRQTEDDPHHAKATTMVNELMCFAKKAAVDAGGLVSDDAEFQWTNHYLKQFYHGLAHKGLTYNDKAKALLKARAVLLGTSAAHFAKAESPLPGRDPLAHISRKHAHDASFVVDCVSKPKGNIRMFLDWCNLD